MSTVGGVLSESDQANKDDVESDDCRQIFEKIELWKKHLLDLTRRNRLLYLTESKANKMVEIHSPNLRQLIDMLVKRGRSLDFPMKISSQSTLSSVMFEKRAGGETAIQEGDLETNLSIDELQRRLYRLRREWLTWQEEQGIHTLFLAVGFLKWREATPQDEEYLAPIILIPVGLEKKSFDEPYSLMFVEEDIVINPALEFKLETDFGIDLPELPVDFDGATAEHYLNNVEKIVRKLGWQVTREARLGRFTYEKFVMYKDLTDHREEACRHPIIRALAKVPVSFEETLQIPYNIDEVTNPVELFPILDADSSQTEVLLRARHGQNLVVQGPPGTGKSQTIANLIAQGLRDGKKILFVSEKMAALEVVYRRLKAAGLSFACLEVHSHKSDKVKVVQELAKTLRLALESKVEPNAREQYEKLIRLRDRLNSYVTELHKPRGGLRLSAFQVHGRLTRLLEVPKIEFKLPDPVIMEVTPQHLDELLEAISQLQHVSHVFDNLNSHPWYGIEVKQDSYSDLLLVDEIIGCISSLLNTIIMLQGRMQQIALRTGINPPASLDESRELVELMKFLSQPPVLRDSWLRLSVNDLNRVIQDAKNWKERCLRLKEQRNTLEKNFDHKVFTLSVKELLERFTKEYKTPFRFFKSNYRRDMEVLKQYWISKDNISYKAVLAGLSTVVRILEDEKWLKENHARAEELFGHLYSGEATDWDSIINSLEWLEKIMQILNLSELPVELIRLMANPHQLSQFAKNTLDSVMPILNKAFEIADKLSRDLKSFIIEGGDLRRAPYSTLTKWLDSKLNPEDLRDWLKYQRAVENCWKMGLEDFMEAALKNQILAKDLRDAFLQRFWKSWLAEAYRESPILAEFTATSHEQIIREFVDLDRKLKEVTISLVRQSIAQRQPKAEAAIARESQIGILLREAQKRRRIKPLRRLFAEIPHLIQELKPCLLMSPLSVASYLGTSPYRFDMVIFDEASQIPPEDAIGPILRGAQLIVAGDDKQLPPTRFFQADIDFDEESEEEGIEEPLESILDECLALPGFKRVLLKWHYRSKKEELIAFSNNYFYEGELVTFPSPDAREAPGAIEFHYVPDAIYDRGGSRKNLKEAKVVAELIEEHFRQHGSKSTLGVITLNIAQEEAIWEEWERRKALKPDLGALSEANPEEPLFIKSLEKVQGDERDHVIISLGYGRDARGVLSMNFGPINQSGGERRLNVAVTRAREKLILVSSILPHEIDLSRLTTGSRGVAMLKNYLEYAYQGGRFPTETYGGGEPESEFEYDVKKRLEARGLKVDAQVGCSGFRIDLAIRHPKHKDRYILGVECDGATYHSHRSARDRDRLRQEILEKLGWKIYRVWSTDWVKNPDKIVENIFRRVQELVEERGVPAIDSVSLSEPTHENSYEQPSEQNNTSNQNEVETDNDMIETNPYGFKTYEEYKVGSWRPSVFSLQDLEKYIGEIVRKESPVHVNTVIRRIAEIYRLRRVGTRARKIIRRAIWLGVERGEFQKKKKDFLWSGDDVTPRIPSPGEPPRPIEEIAIEELMAAVETIVKKELGIKRKSLINTTARALGYNRTGAKVEERINEAVERLLRENRLTTYGDQIVLNTQ
ncbi:MAG: DUF3320 domain-containing protein [Thermoproteota archaeon]